MSKPSANRMIRLRGVRHNNLKNFNLDLPLNQLVVITGLSGSGKSSLAFDTLFAEGQRRYIETFSPYARQFFDRMDKPRVDSVEGIPPAIAIEQRNAVKTTRSTVGTMTEICDYMKTLWPQIAQLYCRNCRRAVRKDSPQQIWETVRNSESRIPNSEALVTFEIPLAEKLSLEESIGLITKQGYQRLLVPAGREVGPASRSASLELNEAKAPWGKLPDHERSDQSETAPRRGRADARVAREDFPSPPSRRDGGWEGSGVAAQPDTAVHAVGFEVVRADEAVERLKELRPKSLTVVQDRLKVASENRARFVEACEQAYHFGKGKLAVHIPCADAASPLRSLIGSAIRFSNRFHCAQCDIEYREASSALFSFNHPLGACPACRGFGRIISIDYDLALPDRSKTLAEGVVKPWLGGHGVESQQDLMKFCEIRKAPTDVPFEQLSKKWRDWVIYGDPDYGKDADHEWPRAWYGVKGYFRWLESKAYKMHVRVLLSRYRAYTPCPDCQGKRFQPEALLYKVSIDKLGLTRRRLDEDAGSGEDASIVHPKSQITLADFYQLPVHDALRFIEQVASRHQPKPSDPIGLVLNEVRSRLGYLVEVGLGYLTLDRPTRTLSGGETERVNLTTCLGTRLVNTLYVLDEPSVGLHPRDTGRLIKILEHLRDLGNTVVVVEHEASVIRAANRIVDLGPGHGESGGQLVFEGTYKEILQSEESITGQYLSGRKQIAMPQRRQVNVGQSSRLSRTGQPVSDTPVVIRQTHGSAAPGRRDPSSVAVLRRVDACPALTLAGVTLHNLKDISVEIPLGRFVCVTGVSGSGKTTLVREVLLPALEAKLRSRIADSKSVEKASDRFEDENDDEEDSPSTLNLQPSTRLTGWEQLGRAVLVDQSPLGKTPRSNPVVYIGAFDDIRELFAQTDAARRRGLNASAFSFNSTQGQCERCRGAGFEKIEMQFLSDVFIRCPDCSGRRYRPHILEVKVSRPLSVVSRQKPHRGKATNHGPRTKDKSWSIADLLDATVDEVIGFLGGFPDSRSALRAVEKLRLLVEVGLGYLRLGQPINTLSGGESQRLKLVSHLAESGAGVPPVHPSSSIQLIPTGPRGKISEDRRDARPTLFLFDEPTTGLHFDDIRVLLKAFQRLVDAGHSVLVIEHNLDVIKCADWIIDLGPDAGDEGGDVVAEGTPEDIAASPSSHTSRFLREILLGPANAFSSDQSPEHVLQSGPLPYGEPPRL